jgi:hypothetical protein
VDGVGGDGGVACPSPAAVESGGACNGNGLTCPWTATGCDGNPLDCTCAGGSWVCQEPPPCIAPQPVCPAPSAVQEGFTCDVSSGTSCVTDDPIVDCEGDVTGYLSCVCTGGTWACPFPPVQTCEDAGGPCPKPNDIVQDTACSSDGQQCPGNPQVCGGQVLYDAFECEQGLWQDVAVTDCDVDAGQ